MLTRIEIDGFKSFLDFELDVPPFLALVGPNSSGKSNLLDALAFARAAIGLGEPHMRSGEDPLLDARRGKPQELFHQPAGQQPVPRFDIRVEAEVGLPGQIERFRAVMEAHRASGDWSLDVMPEWSAIEGWRREAEAWHFHVPAPQAMRRPVTAFNQRPLTEDAGNLAAVLGRMKATGELDDLVVDLSALVPDVTGVRPVLDEREQEWSFDILVDHEPMPARLASDGTLRVLALLAALYDEPSAGLLMAEEIENGLHPSRLGQLLERISQRVGRSGQSWRQVILTTHSPVAVSTLYRTAPEALVFLDSAWRTGGGSPRSRVTVAKPVRQEGALGTFVSPRQVRTYLSSVGQP
ncbi:AAA family ATPase [Nonomuraea sp. PA05]|uniref:AAA family ATPase n=1 Tax=Nonomuraea sp. PA05 TaxID=2604466 RepID=UPI0011DBF121|nr:ATP-binding protein [Nonomuraea sp. PA05]TYB63266.1 AAA family ATPase [Nonomuraea sp. PA05]